MTDKTPQDNQTKPISTEQHLLENNQIGKLELIGNNIYQIVNVNPEPPKKASLDSFLDSLDWIERKSKHTGLEGLYLAHQDDLVSAISQARGKSLDFQPVELAVLELTAHYVFYYLKGLSSPVFGQRAKQKYCADLKELITLKQTIRTGKTCLSNLIREEAISKLVKKMEAAR